MKKIAALAAAGILLLTACSDTYTWYDVDPTVDKDDDCFSVTRNTQDGEDEDTKKQVLLGTYCKVPDETESPSPSESATP